MYFQYLRNRLFRKRQWEDALGCGQQAHFDTLRQLTVQRINEEHQAVIRIAEAIRAGGGTVQAQTVLPQLQGFIDRLSPLLPFTSPGQRRKIEDAIRTADYVRSLLPAPKEGTPTQMTYYSVYIPTLKGAFYYLGSQVYTIGDIVSIPFGRENNIIFGIVEGILCDDYWKLPIPLWKMKYIEGNAPQAVVDEYRQQHTH